MTQPAVQRARALRWAVPVAAAAVVAAIASGAFSASADVALPPRSAARLLADIESASVPAFQGTVVEMAALGLPELPSVATGQGGADGSATSMLGLLSGSHTVKVWYGGPQRQRVALLQTVGETDVFHNGTDLWQWDSNSNTAAHMTLPSQTEAAQPVKPMQTGALTPDQLARQALAAIDPSTAVSIDAERFVARRKAYELVLTPKDSASRVGSVRIAVDGETSLPLGVQVFGRGNASSPALDVSFTSITFGEPDAGMFEFSPPAGATVTSPMSRSGTSPDSGQRPTGGQPAEPQILGTGWTSVAYLRLPQPLPGAALGSLQSVSGTWGAGRLLDSALLSALITTDGRVFVGPVDPAALFAAAAQQH